MQTGNKFTYLHPHCPCSFPSVPFSGSCIPSFICPSKTLCPKPKASHLEDWGTKRHPLTVQPFQDSPLHSKPFCCPLGLCSPSLTPLLPYRPPSVPHTSQALFCLRTFAHIPSAWNAAPALWLHAVFMAGSSSPIRGLMVRNTAWS